MSTTTTLQPDGAAGLDTYLWQRSPTYNYGAGAIVLIGTGSTSDRTGRGLLAFALPEEMDGADIVSATLSATVLTGTSTDIGVHRAITAWPEGSKPGAVPDADTDGCTWNLRNANGSVAWGAAGGLADTDYVATATDAAGTLADGIMSWDVTADVAAFVGGATNNGWWLISSVQGTLNTQVQFYTSDENIESRRPTLVIVWDAATPTEITGTASITLAGVTSSATGTVKVTGSGSATLDAVTVTATGTTQAGGTASITLDGVTGSATGTVTVQGSASITLDGVTSSAAGTVAITGTGTATLADVTASATGTAGWPPITGQASITLDGVTGAATGTVTVSGQATLTLDGVTSAATATVKVTGTASVTLAGVTSAAVGEVISIEYVSGWIVKGPETAFDVEAQENEWRVRGPDAAWQIGGQDG